MIERLKKIKEKYEELTKDLINPDILADMSVWQKKSKEQSELLSDPEIKASYDKLFEGNNVALVNYKNIYSLVTDEEFKNERIQMEKEFNYLKTKNK